MARLNRKQNKPGTENEPRRVQLGDGDLNFDVSPGFNLRHTLVGHTRIIYQIAWSPDGQVLASASHDGTIRLWDTETGRQRDMLRGGSFLRVAWSPTGQMIASTVAGESEVTVWDVHSLTTRSVQLRKNVQGFTLAWAPNGQALAYGTSAFEVLLCDSKGGEEIQVLDGHTSTVTCLAWSQDGTRLASASWDTTVCVRERGGEGQHRTLSGHTNAVLWVAWSPTEPVIASGSLDGTIRLWDVETGRAVAVLEGHTSPVLSLALSPDGKLLASTGTNEVRIWDYESRNPIAVLDVNSPRALVAGVAFHPSLPLLATVGLGPDQEPTFIHIWELDYPALVQATSSRAVKYTSAKIVLVGESNVGKSCLAMRLAENRYPDAHEQSTTHGMRFWTMGPERLDPVAAAPPGERRDVVLWDMGGQDEYRLVHQLFLHDTTLALVLLDPTRGRTALEEVESWNRRLEKQLQGRRAVKLLIGAKVDAPSDIVDTIAIERLRVELGFSAYIETSALTGRGIDELRNAIAAGLDWDTLTMTSRPELFQRIRDEIEARRIQGEIVLRTTELEAAVRQKEPQSVDKGAVEAVTAQLAAQGVIAVTKLASGEQVLVLQLPVIEAYAGALIVAARNNPRGVPAIEERDLASSDIHLPGVKTRLPSEQESAVLRIVVELLIEHGICFRHQGLLIFPTLFPTEETEQFERLPHSVSLYYDFTGAIDNIYASLVVWLAISGVFGTVRLWPNRAEFDEPGAGVCGIRQIKRRRGLAHADLFFAEETTAERRRYFSHFVEEHLRLQGVEVQEHQAIKCRGCGYEISEKIVHARIEMGKADVLCPICETTTLISVGVDTIRARDPESDRKIFALRREIEERAHQDAEQVVQVIGRNGQTSESQMTVPVRILHLSDLHFTDETSVDARLQPLLDDVRRGRHWDSRRWTTS